MKYKYGSKSSDFLKNRQSQLPYSHNTLKKVSSERRDMLQSEFENNEQHDNTKTTHLGNVLSSIKKQAQNYQSGGIGNSIIGGSWKGSGGDTVRQANEIYSPLWLNSNLNLPRDRGTINAWCRAFFSLNPIVHNAINLHSTYPISKLNLRCKNKKHEQFFNEMIEEIDLLNICTQISQEYWLLGEAFPYTELNETTGKWERIFLQNPDYVVVKKTVVTNEPVIMLKPDENLRRIVLSNKPFDISQRQMLDDTIINYIRKGQNIPLDNFSVSHICRKISPYQERGIGLPVCAFRQLMLFDLYRECKYVQAHGMVNPLTLVTVGTADYKPTIADLEAYRQQFEEAQYDKDYKIFTHDGVKVERVGYSGGVLDVSGDVQQLLKEIYIGLMVPNVIMDGGGDISYQNGGVALDVLKQRYMQFRGKIAAWLKHKIFAPIAQINEFYDYEDGKRVLSIPDIEWNYMSLFDGDSYINSIKDLSKEKHCSLQTVYRSLGLDWEEEKNKIRSEKIDEAISKKEDEALSKMSLNELRSLGHDAEIIEYKQNPVPGEDPGVTPPAGGGDAGGLGGGLSGGLSGGLPSLPSGDMGAPSGDMGGGASGDMGAPAIT